MQGKQSVNSSSAPPSPCSPSHLSNPQSAQSLVDSLRMFSHHLSRDIALLITRLTLESHTTDQRLLALLGLFDPQRHIIFARVAIGVAELC